MTAEAATETTADAAVGSGQIDVIVVASWFPAYDDPAAGRFVADQAEALAATGVARVSVVSFDTARLSGGAASRGRQAAVVLDAGRKAAATASPLFQAPAWAVDPALPVARLSIPDGLTTAAGPAHAAAHRRDVLGALGRRLVDEGWTGNRGVVHAHTVYPDGAGAVALADALGWPLVLTEHSSFVERIVSTPALRDAYAAALGRAHRTLAVSEMLARELRSTFPEHATRIEVLPNAVPMDLFPLGTGERVTDQLLFVGYRKVSKGIENLLRAVAIAREARPSVTLRLLGRSPDAATEQRWVELAGSLGLGDAVSFEDPIDRRGIAEAMATASLFVHPSPRETFGVVAVEALASGLPVVATDSGGVSEILGVEPERVGAIVPIDDPVRLGQAIVETLGRRASFDPSELRASVERRFGSAFIAERLLVLYREALVGTPNADAAGSQQIALRASVASPARTIVVALDRERAALRLGTLPDELRETIVLITAIQPADVDLPAVGLVVQVAVDTTWRPTPPPIGAARRSRLLGRLVRLATDPRGTIARRLGRGAGSEAALAPAIQRLRQVLASQAGAEILPLDGHDHLVAEAVVSKGNGRLASGGLRRLADAWNAARVRD
jgi:glycogen(starch) synthase